MSMKTSTSRPLSVADIQQALRPRVLPAQRPAKPSPARTAFSAVTSGPTPSGSPAPLLADMLDQARVHTAVLRSLLADAVAEEDAARARIDETRRHADDLAPSLERNERAAAATTAQTEALNHAADRATAAADRLARLLAAGECLADDLRARQTGEFDRQLGAFIGAVARQSGAALADHARRVKEVHTSEAARTLESLDDRINAAHEMLAELDGRITTLTEHAADIPGAVRQLEALLTRARRPAA
jgi:hypothetical protein